MFTFSPMNSANSNKVGTELSFYYLTVTPFTKLFNPFEHKRASLLWSTGLTTNQVIPFVL